MKIGGSNVLNEHVEKVRNFRANGYVKEYWNDWPRGGYFEMDNDYLERDEDLEGSEQLEENEQLEGNEKLEKNEESEENGHFSGPEHFDKTHASIERSCSGCATDFEVK
jgi:hypothetical protein